MKRFIGLAAVALGLALSGAANAKVAVFACEPEWAALAHELGGDRIDAFAATTGLQDPHQIQARPSLIAKMRAADMVVCTGSELEVGWLPVLLRQGANPKVQPGSPGYFEAARFLSLKEAPQALDRSLGDVHAGGNPHVQTDPRNMLPVAAALVDQFARVDPAGADAYKANLAAFNTRWKAAIDGWQQKAATLKGVPVLVQHKSWVYLLDWLGMREVAPLEPKPGIAPSTSYLAELLDKVAAEKPRMILVAGYEDDRGAKWMSDHAKIPVVILPFTVGGASGTDTLTGLFDTTIQKLTAALN
jgi:zinc/manganese transport system substrate-binding protein